MSPIYPGDRVRYTFAWNDVSGGTEAEYLGERQGEPGLFTVLVELTGGRRVRVPLACLKAVNPRPKPNPAGDLVDHTLPGGVRVTEGREPRTHAPYWTWKNPDTAERYRLIWHRRGVLIEYRSVLDGPEISTGVTIPTALTRPQAHDAATEFFQRKASDIGEPPHGAGDVHDWLTGLPEKPRGWLVLFEFEGSPIGASDVLVAVCYAAQNRPLAGAVALWNAGAVEVTNHTTRSGLRTRLIQLKEAFPNECE
ncbi:hypothetical protein AGRA3207_000192 [Actinomadura graeca]|uniref:Uncharacterized protein n=1 Tax=Actinomadura graeca TaxID=2750812 RepID=A0ABX8QLT7_9ACTN|nr:hypothetical protein [Actinomadura graeca]QXJ19630.1 hypothetical protein AGRA3207_000192 [Actinomadura graeca]